MLKILLGLENLLEGEEINLLEKIQKFNKVNFVNIFHIDKKINFLLFITRKQET